MEISFTNTCRTCYQYKNDENLISLYETEQMENVTYKDMLYDCASIEIFTDDNLPSVICQQCTSILVAAYKFKRECHLSEQKLKALLQQNQKTNFYHFQNVKNSSDINKDETTNTIINYCSDNDVQTSHLSTGSPEIHDETQDEILNLKVYDSSNLHHEMHTKTLNTAVEKTPNIHTEIKQFMCNYCNISFTQSGSLTRHIRKHHNLQESPNITSQRENVCSYCEKSFKTNYDLTVHIRRHTGIKPYICSTCNMSFVSMGRLTSHSRIHTGETPFTCKICNKAFSHSSTLYRHVQSHKKPHACDLCQKRFTFLSCLETHKRMHLGLKPHQCKTCGKGFTEKKLLERHHIVHEKDKPHLCNVCGKNFKRTTTLKKHLKNLHGIGKKLENEN